MRLWVKARGWHMRSSVTLSCRYTTAFWSQTLSIISSGRCSNVLLFLFLQHWPHLRKHNGERYAYSSHSQAVLDCLRNRHEWARLVDRGPKVFGLSSHSFCCRLQHVIIFFCVCCFRLTQGKRNGSLMQQRTRSQMRTKAAREERSSCITLKEKSFLKGKGKQENEEGSLFKARA